MQNADTTHTADTANVSPTGYDRRLYRTLARIIWLAAALYLALKLLSAIMLFVLLFVFAFILAVALNPPVMWLERRRIPRAVGAVLVCLALAAVLAFVGWLVVPRFVDSLDHLIRDLPGFVDRIAGRFQHMLRNHPAVAAHLKLTPQTVGRLLPSIQSVIARVGTYTFSALEAFAIGLAFVSTVVYALITPGPLLEGYLAVMPPGLRDPAERAMARSFRMISQWVWSHLILGTVEAVCVGIYLWYMGVPGAMVWASLAFFAELMPTLGLHLLAIPAVLASLAVSPMTAVWTMLFYTGLNLATGHFLAPLVRGREMDLHPVSLIFALLALVAAYGPIGALIAVPMTGIIKIFFQEFYQSRQPADVERNARVERILERRVAARGDHVLATQAAAGDGSPPARAA